MLRISGMTVPLINSAIERSCGEDLNIAQNRNIRSGMPLLQGFWLLEGSYLRQWISIAFDFNQATVCGWALG